MLNLKSIIPLILLQILLLSTKASTIDSLLIEFENAEDSVKFSLYNKIYMELKKTNIDSAILIMNEGIKFARKKNNNIRLIGYKNNLGNAYAYSGELEKAKEHYEFAYQQSLELENQEHIVKSLNNLGSMYNEQGHYDIASEYFFKGLKITEEHKLKNSQTIILNNIGLLFNNQKDYDRAIKYYQKSIEIKITLNDLKGIALLYNNIGVSYYYMGVIDSVLVSFKRSLEMYIQLDDKLGQTRPLFNIGELYSIKGDYEMALEYYNKSLEIEKELGYKSGYATSLVYIGSIYAELENFKKALSYQREGLMVLEQLNIPIEIMDAYEAIHESFNLMGNSDSALYYFKEMTLLKDSLFTLNKTKQIDELEAIYKTEKKEKEILQLEKQREKNRKIFIALISILLLLVMLSAFLIIFSRLKEKALIEKTRAQEQSKQFKVVIEAQENERKRLAGELHDSVGPLLSLTQLYISDLTESDDIKKEEEKELLEKSQNVLQEACDETRNISHNLMPGVLIRLGLVSAIKELVNKVKITNQFDINFDDNGIIDRFNESTEISFYRVLQELLNNIFKHANASKISISLLKENNHIAMKVHDNGKGFNTDILREAPGIGWKSIYSRLSLLDGSVNIQSNSSGTLIKIACPQ